MMRPMSGHRALLGVLALAVVAASCARTPPVLPPPLPLDASESEAVLAELAREAMAIRRYRALVRIRGKGPEGGFDGKLVVLFERPEKLRVELLGPFGSTRWSAVSDEEGITAYFPGRRQYVREHDVEDIVGRLLGIRLSPAEVMALLSGVGLPLSGTTVAEGERQGEMVRLRLQEGGELTMDASGQVTGASSPRYRVSYPTEWKRRRRQVPDRLRIESPSLEASLWAEDVEVNVSIEPEAFVLELPADAVRLRPAEIDGEAVFVTAGEK
jgi:outer membrane lipoprotein-sorting protein